MPAVGRALSAPRVPRQRVLTGGELRTLWPVSEALVPVGRCGALLALTGQRKSPKRAGASNKQDLDYSRRALQVRQKHRCAQEMRDALQAWALRLQSIIAPCFVARFHPEGISGSFLGVRSTS